MFFVSTKSEPMTTSTYINIRQLLTFKCTLFLIIPLRSFKLFFLLNFQMLTKFFLHLIVILSLLVIASHAGGCEHLFVCRKRDLDLAIF